MNLQDIVVYGLLGIVVIVFVFCAWKDRKEEKSAHEHEAYKD